MITDLCVLDVTDMGFEVIELDDGVTRDEVQRRTEAAVRFSASVA
jgi:acyl CoA:acetate/3-ketoacid CoA transferase beta subunit